MQHSPYWLLPLLALVPATATAQEDAPEENRPRLIQPDERWTGRWIVHVARDDAHHRAVMRELGVLRRGGEVDALRNRIEVYAKTIERDHLPIIDLALAHGAAVMGTTWLAGNILLDEVGPELLDALLARADVLRIQPDHYANPQMEVATDAAHHNSDAANQQTTPGGQAIDGTGVTIGIIDSGVDGDHAGSGRPHAAFFPGGNPATTTGPGLAGSRILSMADVAAFSGGQPPEDTFGHGTRIASIALGAEFNALADVDDAPAFNATLRSYKISDDFLGGGIASTFSMDAGFQDVVSDGDVVVANMSYDGTADITLSPNLSIESATLADVFVSLSAGNYGTDLGFAHYCYNALVVGASAVGAKGPLSLPGFVISAVGPLSDGRTYPQILAVGEAVTCAQMDNEAGAQDSFGTSAAAGLVAGSAALVRQADPALTQLETKAILLNTSEEITVGDPNAAGFGYLRTDRAVEDALAGLVVSETITTGVVTKHTRFFGVGDEIALTAVWNREDPAKLTIDDLDLRLRDPLGNLVAWSASLSDNIEQIRMTASVAGVYEIEVVPIQFDGDGSAEYALAGVDSPSIDPSSCTPGAPTLLSKSPSVSPTLTQSYGKTLSDFEPTNTVILTGCNFGGLTSGTLGGKPIGISVLDDNTMVLDIGIPVGVGSQPLAIAGPGSALNDSLEIVPADNVLATSPTIDLSQMQLDIGGKPGDFYAVALSPDLLPTSVPGLFSVDIGAGLTTLTPILFGNLNGTNGVEEFHFSGIGGISGTFFYFQGITLDATTPTPPWTSTNVASVLFVF